MPDRLTCQRHEFHPLPLSSLTATFRCLWCATETEHAMDIPLGPLTWLAQLSEATGDAYLDTPFHAAWNEHQPPPAPLGVEAWPTVCRRRPVPGTRLNEACPSCGHAVVLHPLRENPSVKACVICLTLASAQAMMENKNKN